ncbi:inositol monophosphatase family protein [Aspergillus clavatus NRRL 1]|uniref:Inositol-1-monophosphatase n=1 Tax=Aspergillus clavatus (strain ATCC 1007 / CBS 513.65 / DSM 816 / NCTC 3887 / NRRL 1 / QM 1276 / 107) TaxID=344612 RepID=A1CPW8_ASPCL|nr:inositol monophosphatase QutG, putative [Aspergillus clavatus NRRL 1]EAW07689.1 inositol monophosphatase QutG, putative [Aspergillus clavatus NRRL 1]
MAATQFSQEELDEIYTFAVDLGWKAGQLLLDSIDRRIDGAGEQSYEEKDNAVDIVTQTDEDVETFIKTAIRAKYPRHNFHGEETYAKGQSREYLIDEQPTWCIDPLDGTVNFTHLFPMFCVSIGFIVNHRPLIGVIYAPFQDQLFSSCANRGAWLNGKRRLPLIRNPIPPMPAGAPSKCIFSCEWGKDRRDIPDGNMARKIESFANMAAELGARGGKGGMVHGVRSLGSATLDLAYTAMGSFDIWWEGGCWEWDVAAGIAILLEAGGLVTTANPPANPETDPIEDVRLGSRLYLAIR